MPYSNQEPQLPSVPAKPDIIQFELKVKQGLIVLADLKGREIRRSSLTLSHLDDIVMLEQKMEALFGLRFHINQVVDPK